MPASERGRYPYALAFFQFVSGFCPRGTTTSNSPPAGFFADPIYGGNRDKVSWKMLGFPGLPAIYADKIDAYRGKRYVVEPQSIADFS